MNTYPVALPIPPKAIALTKKARRKLPRFARVGSGKVIPMLYPYLGRRTARHSCQMCASAPLRSHASEQKVEQDTRGQRAIRVWTGSWPLTSTIHHRGSSPSPGHMPRLRGPRIYVEDGTPQRIRLGLVSLEHGRSNTNGGSLIPSIVTSYI